MRTLRSCLLDEPLARLLAVADAWNLTAEVATVKEAADALAAHMLEAREAARAREALSLEANEALDALVAAGGRMPTATFERRFGAIRPMGPGKLERERPWLSPANPAEAVWYAGFVFRGFDRNIANPIEAFFIPTDLLPALGAAVRLETEPEIAFERDAIPQPPSALQPRSRLLDDVTTLLALVQCAEVKPRANGDWPRETRSALAPMLRDPDGVLDPRSDSRFGFLLRLIERMGWLRTTPDGLRLNAQPVMQWLQTAPDRQLAALFAAWRDDPEWNDLAHADPALKFEMSHAWSNRPLAERAAALRLWRDWLAEADAQPGGGEAPVAGFIASVKALEPDFARVDGRYDTWHIRDARTGEFLSGFEHWERVEGALLTYIVDRALRWLEARGEAEWLSRPAAFEVQADGLVRVGASLRFERFQLARVADWVESREEEFVYRLAPKSLSRAKAQGIGAQRVIDFLERAGGRPLPVSISRAIGRWGERGAEARLEPAALLRARDASILDRLLDLPEVRKLRVERLSPTVAAVRAGAAVDVAAEAARNGLLIDLRT